MTNFKSTIAAIVLTAVLLLSFGCCEAKAQVNVQCVIVSFAQAVNHPCSNPGRPLLCAVEKAGKWGVGYVRCTNPLTSLVGWRRDRSAAIFAHRASNRLFFRR